MKKIILTLLFIFSIGFTYAQNTQFGIKGGLNVASQSFSSPNSSFQPNTSSLIGFHIGGFVEIKISDKFSIQPELLYSAQGGKLSYVDFLRLNIDDPGEYVNYETINNLSYINIPIMFKYYVTEKFTLELGPQLGVLIISKMNSSFNGPTYSGQSSSDSKDLYNSIDYGINLGAGYDITKNFSVGIRYNLGVCNIGKYSYEIKNSVFSIATNYKF